MKITEIFYSIQGEGFLAGRSSVFIRLSGCPLRCKWCDTKYAWDPAVGESYDIAAIIKIINQWPSQFVVVTGGEPMNNPEMPLLLRELKDNKKHITIETAGIAFVPDLPCDLMSISPKLSNSHSDHSSHLNLEVLRKLVADYDYQLKFVVDSQNDLPEIQAVLKEIKDVDVSKVMLMPQAKTKEELSAKSPLIADLCKKTGFAFSHRLHILLWDGTRGT